MRGFMIASAIVLLVDVGSAHAQATSEEIIRPSITVTGYGEVKYPPDIATITYTIRGEGSVSDDAVRAMSMSRARIEISLRAIDPAADPFTSEVRVTAVKGNDCKEQAYGNPQLSNGVCAVTGYVATQSVILRTQGVKDAGTMVGVVGRAGGLTPRISGFTVGDSGVAQRQAIIAAVADAASKANAIAAASHVQLGSILSINSGPRNDAQQIVLHMRAPAPLPPAPPPPPIEVVAKPDLLSTTSYVTVTYAIGQ